MRFVPLLVSHLTLVFVRRKPEQVESLKKMHNKECKGLMVQIRYLKDKFYRESLLRQDVSYQKKYLIQVLNVCSKP
jgi:hypothetical protein